MGGGVDWCYDTIIVDDYMMEARGRIKSNGEEIKSLKEEMEAMKKFSVGKFPPGYLYPWEDSVQRSTE